MTAEDILLNRLRARLPRIDAWSGWQPPRPSPDPMPPLTATDLMQVQAKLDFMLPPLLLRVLQEVGNGGFGPDYGLLGLGPAGFADADGGRSADRIYHDFRKPLPDTPTWDWPKGLLPICSIGCAMYHCLDVANDRILIWEPNAWDDQDPMGTCLFVSDLSLFDWLDRWSRGDALMLLLDHPEAQDYALPRLIPLD